jgi:hypothetical protein
MKQHAWLKGVVVHLRRAIAIGIVGSCAWLIQMSNARVEKTALVKLCCGIIAERWATVRRQMATLTSSKRSSSLFYCAVMKLLMRIPRRRSSEGSLTICIRTCVWPLAGVYHPMSF